MKQIRSFIIIAVIVCLSAPMARVASAGGSPYICEYCVKQCQGLAGKKLLECFNRCEPGCTSGQAIFSGNGSGGVLGTGGKPFYKCEICKQGCAFVNDKFNCCQECELICGDVINCPPK